MKQTTVGLDTVLNDSSYLTDYSHVRLPTVMALYACSAASVWRGVRQGRIPKPYKLSPRTTCWNVGELKAALKKARG